MTLKDAYITIPTQNFAPDGSQQMIGARIAMCACAHSFSRS